MAFIVCLTIYAPILFVLGPWQAVGETDVSGEDVFIFYVLAKQDKTGRILFQEVSEARAKKRAGEVSFELPLWDSLGQIAPEFLREKYKAVRTNDREVEVELHSGDMKQFKYVYSADTLRPIARKMFSEYHFFGGIALAALTIWLANLVWSKMRHPKEPKVLAPT